MGPMSSLPLEALKHQLEGLRHNIVVREKTIEAMRDEIAYLENLNQLDRRKIENLVAQIDEMEE